LQNIASSLSVQPRSIQAPLSLQARQMQGESSGLHLNILRRLSWIFSTGKVL